jgi:hypothetical protein
MVDERSRDDLVALAIRAVRAAREAGCPVAGGDPDVIAKVAVRRWTTFDRRVRRRAAVDLTLDRRIEDLSKGLVANFEKDRRLVGPLITDYRHLARAIAEELS